MLTKIYIEREIEQIWTFEIIIFINYETIYSRFTRPCKPYKHSKHYDFLTGEYVKEQFH